MKKLLSVAFGIGLVSLVAGSAMAAGEPSAKFAAAYTTTPGLESAVVITDATEDDVKVDSNSGYTLATIKVPQNKELLVGVSAEIGLVTNTSVKGKNGGTATAIAGGKAYVTVFAVPKGGTDADRVTAEPGQIMLSERVQTLDATLAGVIQSCAVNCNLDANVLGGILCEDINVVEDCLVTEEQIGLLQNTTAAHHFNFVLPNMPSGVYDIKAVFTTGARAEVDICTSLDDCLLYDPEGTASGSAEAIAVINKTMVTVQQVRAANNADLSAVEIIPQ